MQSRTFPITFAVLLAVGGLNALPAFAGSTNRVQVDSANARPPGWAVKLHRPGLRNFYRVTTNLYRGAQPTAEGMQQLKLMGVKIVINLRTFHSDKDRVAGTGLKSVRFETEPWHSDKEDVVRLLKVVTNTNNLPAFVHCERGADRTGLMCAMYRIAVCGWTKQKAIAEMKHGGFGFNPLWVNIVHFIKKADIAALRRKAGITVASEAPAKRKNAK